MSYPQDARITLKETLNNDNVKIIKSLVGEEVNPENRIEFLQMQTNKKLTLLNMERYQKGVFPSVSFSGSLGAGHSNSVFNPFRKMVWIFGPYFGCQNSYL